MKELQVTRPAFILGPVGMVAHSQFVVWFGLQLTLRSEHFEYLGLEVRYIYLVLLIKRKVTLLIHTFT